jgi:hypothetical protein
MEIAAVNLDIVEVEELQPSCHLEHVDSEELLPTCHQ